MRVAIIGAGPSGMSTVNAFQEAKNKGQQIPEVVVFEKQAEIGGLWNYNWRTGIDVDGEPVHNSMYKHLWSNGPKECLEFPDYTFEQHYGKPTCSYPPRLALRDYLMGYNKHHKFDMGWVRASTSVKKCVWLADKNKFEITAQDKATQYKELFDYVIISTGHFSRPHMPDFKGLNDFSGLVMHSHDWRAAEVYKDKTVVVVGKSYSAEDVASQLYKYGAKKVIITHRKKDDQGNWAPMGLHWAKGIEERPLMKDMKANTVVFGDDSKEEVDAIILCTGYIHTFPFLDSELDPVCKNTFWNVELEKSCINPKNNHMFFMSMQDQFYTYNMFAAMGWFARDVIMGKVDPKAPLKDSEGKTWSDEDFVNFFNNISTDRHAYELQGKYTECLMEATGYGKEHCNPGKFVEGINKTFDDWEELKHHDIMGYRNNAHASLITGTMSPKPKTSWLDNKWEDDVEFFLGLGQ